MKRILSLVLMYALTLSLSVTAFAAETGFGDVSADADYAQAVAWCKENGVMNGTSATTFSPNRTLNRAMVAAALYRWEGSPAVSSATAFSDNAAGTYYHDAAIWATENGILTGYSDGRFGPTDPVSRQQLAAFLWRHSKQQNSSASSFADRNEVSSYAVSAVDWAVDNGIMTLRKDNRFAPAENATRAEVASALYACLAKETTSTQNGKAAVVYFSATGSTEKVAGYIANELNADLFELIPVNPYASADLNYSDNSSRVSREHDDPGLRNVELTNTAMDNWSDYDTVFIGYPIWWGIAAWPTDTFVKANNFSGKTVIPFCTSASSGMGESGQLLADMAGTGDWQEGRRFSSGANESEVRAWAAGIAAINR